MASPAYTELEVIIMNWLGRLLGLPEEFLNCSEGPGGGIIQVSILVILKFISKRIMGLPLQMIIYLHQCPCFKFAVNLNF